MTITRKIASGALIVATGTAAASVDMFAGLSNQMLSVDAISVGVVAEFEVLQDVMCEWSE